MHLPLENMPVFPSISLMPLVNNYLTPKLSLGNTGSIPVGPIYISITYLALIKVVIVCCRGFVGTKYPYTQICGLQMY